jgi:pantoate--beta-alanine ligase
VVVSIFVNPTQFGPGEDFDSYPRDFARDEKLCEQNGADFIFYPDVAEMYPEGYQAYVEVTEMTKYLCGKARPSHFRGVTTVCTKLFNAVKPHFAIFGEKDFQQMSVIQRMVKDLNMDLEIVPVATIREEDGLAMSSRNTYLSEVERKQAIVLKRSMERALDIYRQGNKDASNIKSRVEDMIKEQPLAKIDYVSICNQETMEEVETVDEKSFIALAVKFGKTRLIDNSRF